VIVSHNLQNCSHVYAYFWSTGRLWQLDGFALRVTSSVLQATEEKAENARLSSFVGALALGDLVKSTLGPKGMNKILQSASSGDIQVTNDGATILKSIQLDNAAAKILVNISKVQDDEVGDGTTSVCVLAAELLREAEKLIAMKIHPQTIVEGYRVASIAALAALENAAVDHAYVFAFFGVAL
jgi:T-complex protein 1 subunit beta